MPYNNNRSRNSYQGDDGYNDRMSRGTRNNRMRSNGGSRSRNNADDYEPRKHSGCEYKDSYYSRKQKAHVDRPIVHGWNFSKIRGGIISFIASPRSKSETNKKGAETNNPNWEQWAVKVQYPDGVEWFQGLFEISSRRLIIPELQMIANPKAPNGGYFGTYVRRKNNNRR